MTENRKILNGSDLDGFDKVFNNSIFLVYLFNCYVMQQEIDSLLYFLDLLLMIFSLFFAEKTAFSRFPG
jgi:hypothetical protein